MRESLQTVLTFAPIIIGLVAAAFAWRRVTRPLLFLVVSVLTLLGVQAIISPVSVASFLVFEAGTPKAVVHEAYLRSLAVSALAVAAVGSPLLWWLYSGLRRA